MKKLLFALIFSLIPLAAYAQLQVVSGGTGARSFTVGQCIKGNGTSPFTSGTCGSGGSGGGTFSTSTSNVSGELVNYPNNTTDIVLFGSTATTSAPFWFDPNVFVSFLKASTTIADHLTTSYIISTSTATSTFAGGAEIKNLKISDMSGLGSVFAIFRNDGTLNKIGIPLAVSNGGTGLSALGASSTVLTTNGTVAQWNTLATSQLTNDSGFVTSSGVTSITATAPLTGGTITTTGSIGCPTASGSQTGCLSSTDWTTFNNKGAGTVTSVTASQPLLSSGGATPNITYTGLSTTSQLSSSNLLVSNGTSGVYGVSTSTLSASSPLTGSFTQVGSGGSLGIQASGASANGYLSSADFNLLHSATTTFTSPLVYTLSTNAVTCPTCSGSGSAFPFTTTTNFNQQANATTTQLWLQGSPIALSASSTSIFANSSSTQLTVNSTAWFPFVTNAQLAVDSNGKLISGGTGTSGDCVKWGANNTLADQGSACGSGGGSGGGTFSTTTSTQAGRLINYSNNNTDIVSVGGSATTSDFVYIDPNLKVLNMADGGTLNVGGTISFFASSTKDDTFLGPLAGGTLYQNDPTSGGENTAVGSNALKSLTAGNSGLNSAFGAYSLLALTTGNHNTALGDHGMRDMTTGVENTCVGYGCQFSANGIDNVSVGNSTLYHTLGRHDSALGQLAGFTNIVGENDIFIGTNAGYSTNASSSIIIGASVDSPFPSTNGILNIGNILYGNNLYNDPTPSASGGTISSSPTTNGALGIGTTSPFAKLSISLNKNDTLGNAFVISSTTAANATTTLFSISNTGSTTASNGFNITAGCFSINSVCVGGSGGAGTVTSITLGGGLDGSSPITTSGTITAQVGTFSVPTSGQIPYWTSIGTPSQLGSIATTSIGVTGPITFSGTLGSQIGGVTGNFGCATCNTSSLSGSGSTNSWTYWSSTNGLSNVPSSGITSGGVYMGLGTTTPNYLLQLATSTGPQLTLTDSTNTGWAIRNAGGVLYFATTSPTTFATTSAAGAGTSPLQINSSGAPSLTIATTTTTGVINVTTDPNTTAGTSTINMGKIQFDGYNSAGARICAYFVGTTLTAVTGVCTD